MPRQPLRRPDRRPRLAPDARIVRACRVDPLEARRMFYALAQGAWADPNLSYSFMPDGTTVDGYASRLYADLGSRYATQVWQREFARALQTWAQYAPLNFHPVGDDGSAGAVYGAIQGDPRFGDIRFGSRVLDQTILGYTHFPKSSPTGATSAGDVAINSTRTYYVNDPANAPDLFSLVLHETGHALGLDHSTAGSVMYGAYTGTWSDLTADDIAGIRAIYGARTSDVYDAAASNDTLATATPLTATPAGLSFTADLTSRGDVDYYRITIPAGATAATFSVDARGISLLAPKVCVFNTAGQLLATASAGAAYGTAATAALTGLTPGQSYVVAADGATADAFGMGAYHMNVTFADAPAQTPAPAAPTGVTATATSTSQVEVNWMDVTDSTSFIVEYCVDGSTAWTSAGETGAGVTHFSHTGLVARTTYHYRVLAMNAAGLSDPSAVATARTADAPSTLDPSPPAAPTDLSVSLIRANKSLLTWTDNATNEAGFYVERSTDQSTWQRLATLPPDSTHYTDARRKHDTSAYVYRITAFNADGQTSSSDVASPAALQTMTPSAPATAPAHFLPLPVHRERVGVRAFFE